MIAWWLTRGRCLFGFHRWGTETHKTDEGVTSNLFCQTCGKKKAL